MRRKPPSSSARASRARISRGAYRIFLSHSSRDTWLALAVEERIERSIRGVKVWPDEMSLAGGEEVRSALKAAIGQANEVVVMVSNESLRSQWVAWEICLTEGQRRDGLRPF